MHAGSFSCLRACGTSRRPSACTGSEGARAGLRRALIAALGVVGVATGPATAVAGPTIKLSPKSAAAGAQCQVPETDRHHIFNVNLDRDHGRERIDVFNSDASGAPMTGFMVCDRVNGTLVRGQLKYTFTSPGPRDSGLRQAWVGDLNRDGRFEIAMRDIITPSAGELLTIMRQSSRRARTFARLQTIPGDTVVLHPSTHGRATLSVFLKATHTTDGRAHTERWTWSARRGEWACSSQCGFR